MIRTIVNDYEYIHLMLGLAGNLLFVAGSVMFYKAFEQYYTTAVSLFVVGSALMFLGSLGSALRRLYKHQEHKSSAPA